LAENSAPIIKNQRLLTIMSVIIVLIAAFFLWTFRGCIPTGSFGKPDPYVKIYTNLDLKDAANVITRLKDLKIPYRVEDNGSAISVQKEKADDARLGLAEKNLPQGGAVGWEIFNETRMGATDFDRRIQLIRAISGELSRTIKRIEGIQDARVQIVLPETKLFEVSKAPVTAAVLLKFSPGGRLRDEQVSGIIHLVASSVENLQPENVTIVDDQGNILSNISLSMEATSNVSNVIPQMTVKKSNSVVEQEIIKKEELQLPLTKESSTKTVEAVKEKGPEKHRPITDEEKAYLKLKAKEEYEKQLTYKVQELLNQFYPGKKVIARVNVFFGAESKKNKGANLKIYSDTGFIYAPVKKITTVILVDSKVNLTSKIKKATYQTVSIAIPYNKKRGDRIIIKQVPFHYSAISKESIKRQIIDLNLSKISLGKYSKYIIWGGYALGGLIVLFILRRLFRRRQKKGGSSESEGEIRESAPSENEAAETVSQIKDIAKENPERLANLIKKWLTEEGE